MAHVLKQLRDAAVARLTGLPSTGARVHSYRVNPLESITDLPALIVRVLTDSAEPGTIHSPALVERDVELTVFVYAAANAGLDDALDAVRLDVDTALGAPLIVAGHSLEAVYTGSEIDLTEGERACGELQLQYRVTLFHAANAPDVLL
jgi:hypothetical protein